MKTAQAALLWELWRTSRLELSLRILGVSSVAACVSMIANQSKLGELERRLVSGMIVMTSMIVATMSMSWLSQFDNQTRGFSFRLGFARPISTGLLVSLPITYILATSIVSYLIPVLVTQALLGMPVPFMGPSAVIATIVACCIAATWSPSSKWARWLSLSMIAPVLCLAIWLYHRSHGSTQPFLLAVATPGYFDLGWRSAVVCLSTILGSWIVTGIMVDRQRHGAGGMHIGWRGKWSELRQASPPCMTVGAHPFRSAWAAQCWLETVRGGRPALVTGVVLSLFVTIVLASLPLLNPNYRDTPIQWLIASTIAPIVYQLIGLDGALGLRSKQGRTDLSVMDATRPMRSDLLVAIKLSVVGLYSVVGGMGMVVTMFAYGWMVGFPDAWRDVGGISCEILKEVTWRGYLIMILGVVAAYVSSSSLLMLYTLWAGLYQNRVYAATALGILHFVAIVAQANHRRYSDFWQWYAVVASCLLMAGCVVIIVKAWQSRCMGIAYSLITSVLWMFQVWGGIEIYRRVSLDISFPWIAIWIGTSCLLLPLASAAGVTVALSAYRHR